MTDYVAGFLLSAEDSSSVLLVEKRQPEWQAGRLNGVGGKIESGEVVYDAMVREFEEETGLRVDDWRPFVRLVSGEHMIWFFRAWRPELELARLHDTLNDVGERLLLVGASSVQSELVDVIPNLRWLVPLAQYTHDDYYNVHVEERVHYGS
jgi:8-oxo-dGTP diphosphatase